MPLPVVRVAPSPTADAKWRATFEDGRSVDFGRRGSADFTTHGDPHRMLRYLLRHGIGKAAYTSLVDAPPSEGTAPRPASCASRPGRTGPIRARAASGRAGCCGASRPLAAAARRAGSEGRVRVVLSRRSRVSDFKAW